MPRPSKSKQAVPNAIVASAARVVAGRRKNLPRGSGASWQSEAWEMLDTVGELEFYREWMANAGSRCELSVVEVTTTLDDKGQPVTTETEVNASSTGDAAAAYQAMEALFGGAAGQSDMLASMFGHLSIPGETWLVGLLDAPDDPDLDMWRVLSKDEVKEQGNKWQIERGDGEPELYDREAVYVTRIWRPHPRKGIEAHSSVRSALPILRQLVGMSKRDAANIDSRLAGNGALLVPTEVTFASVVDPSDTGDDPQIDPLLAAIIDTGTAALQNQGSAEARFPLLIKAAAEHLDKIKHLSFASDLDDKSIESQTWLIRRLATALDAPAEVLLGLADVNHWTGWLLDENAIKMHVETTLAIVVSGLKTRYLWPCLQGESPTFDPALRRFEVRGSTAKLRQRPNRATEATAARDGMVITDAAWAREVGFDEADLLNPDSDEFRRKLTQKTAGGVGTADVTMAALSALGVNLTPKPSEVDAATPTPTGPTPALETPAAPVAERDIPDQTQAAALLAASEVLTRHAVRRAWNKAGKRGRTRVAVPQGDLDACMDGMWDEVAETAALLSVDPARLTQALDAHTRTLLATGAEYDRRALATVLVRHVLLSEPAAITRGT